jgi:hypothetical protein
VGATGVLFSGFTATPFVTLVRLSGTFSVVLGVPLMRRLLSICFSLAVLSASAIGASYLVAADKTATKPADAQPVELFAGMNSGDLSVKFIPKNDREGQILIENKTKQPVSVQLPASFVGVPVLAQIGANGGGRQRSGSRNGGGNNNQQQTTGGGGGGFGGGGGGFNIAPEAVGKVKVPLVCLEHGKDEPNSRVPYEIRPTSSYTKDARIEGLLTMLGEGNLDQKAAQAAAWHFANNMSWEELNAKKIHHLGGRGDEKYFTDAEMQGAMKIAAEADRFAAMHPRTPESDKTTDSASPESVSYSGKKIYSAETMPDAK